MKYTPKAKAALIAWLTCLSLLALLTPGHARAQGNPTPTPVPLSQGIISDVSPTPESGGGLLIPTNTPETGGGLLIPTNTPAGGLIIPTSTPAPAEPSFPPLTDAQLTAINLQPADVPADFAANQTIESFTAEGMIGALNNTGASELAASLQQIVSTYGWQHPIDVTYTSCQPTVPISKISSEVGQFQSPAAGRAFFNDPQVQGLFISLGYTLTPTEHVHGWRASRGLEDATCFAQETQYALFFEYWGLLINVSMNADANTDPQLVWNLVDQLVGVVIAHADAQAAQPFPPTPTSGAVVLQPTPVVPASTPTPGTVVVQPTPFLPIPTPVLPTPTPAMIRATLQDIDAVMPTAAELELKPPWLLDESTSGIQSFYQIVTQYQSGGMYELASAVQDVGLQTGLIGQVNRLWSTGLDCSFDVQDLQVAVLLFNDTQGPVTYMNDLRLKQAWLNTGIISSIEPHTMGTIPGQVWTGFDMMYDPCAPVVYRLLIMPYGRFLITVLTIAPTRTEMEYLDKANEYIIALVMSKLDQARLQ